MRIQFGKTWRNWAATSESKPAQIMYPETINEVQEIVREAKLNNNKIRVVGAGHSFTHLANTNDCLISLDRLSGLEAIDDENGTATVFAGTRLYEIAAYLGNQGYAQENLGDINVQSIAGAISTGTHGTGRQFGNISTQVIELQLVTANGEILTLSEKESPQLFKASLVSLGTFGIIVKVSLKIIKSPIYLYRSDKLQFQELEHQLESLMKKNRHFEFFLFPYSDTVQVKTMNAVSGKSQNLSWHKLKTLVMENYLFFLISEICRLYPKTSSFFSKISAKAIGKEKIQAKSHQLFATPRKVRFCEMEYCIPIEQFMPALLEIRRAMDVKHFNVHFPIECRTVKSDDIWLSPSYKRESAYIAFHMYKGMDYEPFFVEMEEIMKKYNGRPHWGKMHTRTYEELKEIYPKLNDFLAYRKQLDPDGLFVNKYLKKMLNIQEDKAMERTS
ncbi:D-arabinono-1,4-lactone oxidase [Cytobacillus horneckiae]|uniref:D-arabinono-1,4-lactone oxidase n=1 Tax=Cytobacillus horneckiae TaxID=549687 RepID=UPI003D9A1F01